jgi:hypothetical protein
MTGRGMSLRHGRMAAWMLAGLSGLAAIAMVGAPSARADATTAWSGGTFNVDTANLIRRDDIVLGQPPLLGKQSMPIGNGVFGAAVWAANGFTAQLNRDDTFPDHRSAGQLVIPGLTAMTSASDYKASVDLYDATYRQSGGGMTATTYVRADKDEMVIDVTGADPSLAQTAQVNLQSGRHPVAAANGAVATLAETWIDTASFAGGTHNTYGSLAALTAGGREVAASTVDANTIQVSVKPNTDGSFRIVVGAPHWVGGDAAATAASLLGGDAAAPSSDLSAAHLSWWHGYWNRVGTVKLSSSDGVADYMENLRTIYLYVAASSERGLFPSSQAGVNDLFNFTRDTQQWGGGQYWFWNLRMQLAANIGAGATDLNAPFFNLYSSNLAGIQAWTQQKFPMSSGICVPETMRFDGTGWYVGTGSDNTSCDGTGSSSYNKRNLSSGAELASWVWRQYLATNDLSFLQANYPLISNTARFLLSYAKLGADGKLHTFPSNAHETQWDVHDPITDISAMQQLFPIVVQAATKLGVDADLVAQAQAAIPEIPDFPRTDRSTHRQLKTPAQDGDGNTVLGFSSDANASYHNSENLDLEPVWPYNLIGDTSPLFNLAKATYPVRQFKNGNDWTYDPVDAARLDMGSEVAATLKAATQSYQAFPNGLSAWQVSNLQEPYDEQAGVTALAINEALATDYDGLLRIAPAIPPGWNAEGTIFLQHQSKVHVQVQGGAITTAVVESGAAHDILVRNPWPGSGVQVVSGSDAGQVVVPTTTDASFTIHAAAGGSYVIQQASAPQASETSAPLTGTPAAAARHLQGTNATIGIDPAGYLPPPPCDVPTGLTAVAWDPTSGATIDDWSQYNRDGSFVNEQPTYATDGPTGSAAVISGGGYLSAGTTTLGYLREATLATELKITAGTTYRRIWDWKTASGGDGDGIIIDLTPSRTLRVITGGQNFTINSQIPTGAWINLVVTIATNGTINVYVNGSRVGGATLAAPGVNGCAGGQLHIGADQTGGQAISTEVDRAAIFTRALSTAEIANWQKLAFVVTTSTTGSVGGSVAPTLALTLGAPATSLGTFVPGLAADYTSSLVTTVTSTAGDAALAVADPSATATGHLVNGTFSLPQPLQVMAGTAAFAPVGGAASPTALLTYNRPISNDSNAITFKQSIGATDALRTGTYAKTLTFTLSTTSP